MQIKQIADGARLALVPMQLDTLDDQDLAMYRLKGYSVTHPDPMVEVEKRLCIRSLVKAWTDGTVDMVAVVHRFGKAKSDTPGFSTG